MSAHFQSAEYIRIHVVACAMATSRATSARKNPPSSVLSSSTVLDEVNIRDSEVSNDSDAELSGVLESEEEQGEPSFH